MIYSNLFSIFLVVQNTGNAKKYFSNFKFENIVFGEEHLISDYITLDNDPNSNLPDSYTVCSSVYVQYCTSNKGIVAMLKHDGSPWYSVEIFTNDRQL